jgi:hypothetical protein
VSKKNSKDTIGNRTLDFLACSAVPEPTAPPRAPHHFAYLKFKIKTLIIKMPVVTIYTNFCNIKQSDIVSRLFFV